MSVDDFPSAGNARAPVELRSPATNVSVWRAALECDDGELAGMASWLAPAEHARAARFGREQLRRRYIVGRASLRWVLGRALALEPAEVPIVRGARGRPRLDGDSDLDFNVSHTEGVALIGLARGCRIGVDIERADRDANADGLARKFLTPAERATLTELPEVDRRARFLRYWTCKEAMSKATGDGLSAPFRRLEVHLAGTIELRAGPDPYYPAHWRLYAVDIAEGYLGTAALWLSPGKAA